MQKKVDVYSIIRVILICVVVLCVIVPVLSLFFASIKPESELYNNPKILPSKIVWKNYFNIFMNADNLKYLRNSIIVTIVCTIVTVLFGSMAAYGLSRLRHSKIVALIAGAIIFVRFYPKIVVVLPYFILMMKLHLLDTVFALIITHVSIYLPLTVLMMITFYADVPKEIEEASRIDGASVFVTFYRVVLPITISGMAATAILTAMSSWNEFLLASSLSSMNAKTLPIAIASYVTDKGMDWGGMAAMSMVAIIPMIIVVFCTQKLLIRGLTAGAVKG